jgi:hypothetical protein
MNSESAWNMFVFRDGRTTRPGPTLARALAQAIRAVTLHPIQDEITGALLLAGELECALTDAGSPDSERVASITDALAAALIASAHGDIPQNLSDDPAALLALIPENPPAELQVSPPEGFAYYALHPLDYADLAARLPLSSGVAGVIGIRSIGSTLSALVMAALCGRGVQTQRITVRPCGHPYDRKTMLTGEQSAAVQSLRSLNAEFLVVDEGPGMSGSSFLSVGDALVDAGVSRDRITFLGSRIPDPDALRVADASRRWRSYRTCFANRNSRLPADATVYAGGGEWRSMLLADGSQWPASWTQMERLKFLSPDRRLLFKFEGFGHFGEVVHQRARQIGEAGYGPLPQEFTQGFSVYPMLTGGSLADEDLTPELLDCMADYCAFRVSAFPSGEVPNTAGLETMLRFNVSQAFGVELPAQRVKLETRLPVLVDGRMLPHEWARQGDRYMKLDAASHCDDHFFPGPADIAWDLAGAILEWSMTRDAAERFLSRYQRASGDDPRARLPNFILAYAVFRLGYCGMAAEAVRGSGEEYRLLAAHNRYRACAMAQLPNPEPLQQPSPPASLSNSTPVCLQ